MMGASRGSAKLFRRPVTFARQPANFIAGMQRALPPPASDAMIGALQCGVARLAGSRRK
jgi:hypothetical protein